LRCAERAEYNTRESRSAEWTFSAGVPSPKISPAETFHLVETCAAIAQECGVQPHLLRKRKNAGNWRENFGRLPKIPFRYQTISKDVLDSFWARNHPSRKIADRGDSCFAGCQQEHPSRANPLVEALETREFSAIVFAVMRWCNAGTDRNCSR